jgi:carbamoyltransferase
LADGGAALLDNGSIVFAAIEERYSRVRYSNGFTQSLANASKIYGSELCPIDAVAFSSCCGPLWNGKIHQKYVSQLIQSALPDFSTPKIVFVGHHASHVSLGFMLSGFDEALVAVVDGFGNLLDDTGWDRKNWWNGPFERHSYYRCLRLDDGRFSMQLLARDAAGVDEIGLGELYGSLTHFCGYTSYQHAGTVMALAAFGSSENSQAKRFVLAEQDKLQVQIHNNHPHKAEEFACYLAETASYRLPVCLHPAGAADTAYCNIVATVQAQLEEGLTHRLTNLADMHGLKNIVVSGGVALNCLAMGKLARNFGGSVFVPPAPGDTGQALGNAIWAACCIDSQLSGQSLQPFTATGAPFWGLPASEASCKKAADAARMLEGIDIVEVKSLEQQAQIAARALSEGKLVATCLGRSEYGPRALGARSVLADPRNREMVEKVNRFKQREPFRPFAPSILAEHAAEYFQSAVDSPYMSFALPLRSELIESIPAIAHADGTARLQTVAADSPSPLRMILEEFYRLTGVPLLLNTSFNRKGEPMVETVEEALTVFKHSNLYFLLLSNQLVFKRNRL